MRLEQAYSAITATAREVEKRVHDSLYTFASDRGFLVAGRTKTLQSLSDKLETGRYKNLTDIDDLVAFSIIIDTRDQEREVLSFLKGIFNVTTIKSGKTLSDERVFDFDVTRVYAHLKIMEAPSPLESVKFEIQIRTLLQHAWSKALHTPVYKAEKVNPRELRLAAELLAQLESVDRSLARFRTAALGVKKVNRVDTSRLDAIVRLIDKLVKEGVIPAEMRPANGRRFASSLMSAIDLRNDHFLKAIEVIETFYRQQQVIFPRSVSLYELGVLALSRSGLLTKRSRVNFYITDEALNLFPELRSLNNRVIISGWI